MGNCFSSVPPDIFVSLHKLNQGKMTTANKVIFLIFFGIIFIASCSNDAPVNNTVSGNNNTLPDAVFDGSVSGDYNEQIHILVTGNYLNNGNTRIDGGYVTNNNLMILTASVIPNVYVSINAHTGGVDTVTVNLNQDNMDIASYNNFGIGASGFKSVSGTLSITKTEYLQTVGNDYDWFVDGNYSMSLVNTDTPPKQVNISGSFKAIHISPEN